MTLARYTDGWKIAANSRGRAEAQALDSLSRRLEGGGLVPVDLRALRLKKRGPNSWGVLADVICETGARPAQDILDDLLRLQAIRRGDPVKPGRAT
mgnify:CR=1 FL=1